MRIELKQLERLLVDILLVSAFIFTLCALVWIASYNANDYAAGLSKKITLLENTPQPRLILVGGSGVAVGIDSPLIEKQTGLHPINMGLYGALGPRFMFLELRGRLNPGDIVLFIPEHTILQQPTYGDGFYLLEMLHANPAQIRNAFTPHSAIVMMRAFPSWIQQQIMKIIYKSSATLFGHEQTIAEKLQTIDVFNSYGDVDIALEGNKHISEADLTKETRGYISRPVDPGVLATLKEFANEARAQDVYVFFVPPALPKPIIDANASALEKQRKQIIDAIGNERVLGTDSDFAFPIEDFLDPEHTNQLGKEAKTKHIIELLKPILLRLANTVSRYP